MNQIIKVKKDEDGHVTDVMLEGGQVIPLNHAILLAKDYEIEGVGVFRGEDGGEFLKADPDVMDVDNINDLPTFK